VGEGAVDAILQARQDGPFKSLDDFCARVDLRSINKKVIESLVKAGAMDTLESGQAVGAARGKLLAASSDAVDRQQKVQADISRGQGLLFGLGELQAPPAETGTPASALHEHDVLSFEKEVLGFYFSGHPLLGVKELLRVAASHEISQLTAEITKPVRLAGMISQVKRMVTKEEGKQWAKCIFEDLSGEISLLVFPKRYAEGLGNQLKAGAIVAVEGKLSFRGDVGEAGAAGTPELMVYDILPLETAASRNARRLRLTCAPEELGDAAFEELREVLERSPGPCPVILEHETPEGTAILELDARVTVDKNLLESIVKILGEKAWRIESAS
jgi:DNA polymerase-3 subunit alpha